MAKLALSRKNRNDAPVYCSRRCSLRYAILSIVLVTAAACTRSAPLESTRVDCDGGVRIFAQNAVHCVYDPGAAPESCAESVPFRYETENDVVCSARDDLSDTWLATIIDASYVQDAAISDVPDDAAVSDGVDAASTGDSPDLGIPGEGLSPEPEAQEPTDGPDAS